jgi:AraC-like DNA-binding protein
MAIGATEEGADAARQNRVRAALLHGVKAEIIDHLGNPDLSVAFVAQRQHLTPRHVHRLFERDGMTFSQFVLGERLARAYRMLADPAHCFLTVTAIAYACGFGDLSYFNRSFRRRYDATPSDVRRGD